MYVTESVFVVWRNPSGSNIRTDSPSEQKKRIPSPKNPASRRQGGGQGKTVGGKGGFRELGELLFLAF